MLFDVKMRVWSGPRTFDDAVVQVEADSGDEAVTKASKLAGEKRHIINTVMPTPDQEKGKAAEKKAPKPKKAAEKKAG